MNRAWASIIRSSAFVSKETTEALRQPRLLVTLVVGPFLILLVFGAGLRDTDPPLRTVFVAPDDRELATEVEEFARDQGERLEVAGVIEDEQAARAQLHRGEVDLVVVFPADVEERVRDDEQALVRLLHDEMDPLESQAVVLFMQHAVAQVNQQLLASTVEEGQRDSAELQERVASARTGVEAVRSATDGEADEGDVDADLARLEEDLATFRSISPEVIVAPLRGETERLGAEGVELGDYYAPAVVAVLLQHLLVTLVALSVVRETELGTPELYRVAPLRLGELIVGKYVAHTLIAVGTVAALLAALVLLLGVPMRGSWLTLVGVVLVVVLASAGLGFCVAAISRSDGQAVQYAMLLLLVTIFFSGLILSLERFFAPARWVGFLVPATYAVRLLRDEMLRGQLTEPLFLWVLVLAGVAFGLLGAFGLRRRLMTA